MQRGFSELALAHFCVEPVFSELFEDLPEVILMFFHVFAVDQNVVQVDEDKFFKKFVEYIVHKCHKCGWSVGQAKGHD